jgi:hypothetical protein
LAIIKCIWILKTINENIGKYNSENLRRNIQKFSNLCHFCIGVIFGAIFSFRFLSLLCLCWQCKVTSLCTHYLVYTVGHNIIFNTPLMYKCREWGRFIGRNCSQLHPLLCSIWRLKYLLVSVVMFCWIGTQY